MTVSQPLSNPAYYSITAQLNGYGTVNCALEINGSVRAVGPRKAETMTSRTPRLRAMGVVGRH
jgi:hypothetical protein